MPSDLPVYGLGGGWVASLRDDVQYVSLHGDPRSAYPYFIGHAEETGTGRGLGSNVNLPLPRKTSDDEFTATLVRAREAVDAFDPSVIVVSLGVDTHELDPLGDFRVTTESYETHGRLVAALGRPLVILQEGGYHVPSLGNNIRNWLTGASAKSAPDCSTQVP